MGPWGLEGHGGGAGRLLKNSWVSQVIPSLAGVGRDEALPWAGVVPAAAGIPRGVEALGGEPRSRALVCFRCRERSEAETEPGFSCLRFSMFSPGRLHTLSQVSLAVR